MRFGEAETIVWPLGNKTGPLNNAAVSPGSTQAQGPQFLVQMISLNNSIQRPWIVPYAFHKMNNSIKPSQTWGIEYNTVKGYANEEGEEKYFSES